MAYMSQEKKAALLPAIKAVLSKYHLKASVAVRHHSTLVVNIASGPIDFIGNYNEMASKIPGCRLETSGYMRINPYWYKEHFTGVALECMKELISAMMVGNHDRSDIMTDYFDVGWYVDVNIGKYESPYQITK